MGNANGVPANVGQSPLLASGAGVIVNADGTLSYDPNHAFDWLSGAQGAANHYGADSFTYTLAGGSTATAYVNGALDHGDKVAGGSGGASRDSSCDHSMCRKFKPVLLPYPGKDQSGDFPAEPKSLALAGFGSNRAWSGSASRSSVTFRRSSLRDPRGPTPAQSSGDAQVKNVIF